METNLLIFSFSLTDYVKDLFAELQDVLSGKTELAPGTKTHLLWQTLTKKLASKNLLITKKCTLDSQKSNHECPTINVHLICCYIDQSWPETGICVVRMVKFFSYMPYVQVFSITPDITFQWHLQ